MVLLPFLLTFNEVLTRIVEKFVLYDFLQERIAPYQAQIIGLIVKLFGMHSVISADHITVNGEHLRITWNCLGWQSLLLFTGSLFVGLQGFSYTNRSKLHVIVLGLFGIFWVNIFRMSFTVLLAGYSMPLFKVVFHDYLAAFVTIIYLFGFWWFAYKFVLEEREKMDL
jgi:exosortase/archaeosortase family protein